MCIYVYIYVISYLATYSPYNTHTHTHILLEWRSASFRAYPALEACNLGLGNTGPSKITYTILGVPYYIYSIVGPIVKDPILILGL